MANITIDIADDVYQRLVDLSRTTDISLNQLVEDISKRALSEFDRKQLLRGSVVKQSTVQNQGLRNMLDEHFLEVKGLI